MRRYFGEAWTCLAPRPHQRPCRARNKGLATVCGRCGTGKPVQERIETFQPYAHNLAVQVRRGKSWCAS